MRVRLRDIELRRHDERKVCFCGRSGIGPHWHRAVDGCPTERQAAAAERAGAAS